MLNRNVNQKVLDSVGEENFNQYMLLTKGSEINSILDSHSPVYEMYKYRHELLDKNVGQDISFNELELLLNNNNNIKFKQGLEQIFLEYLSDAKFKLIKDILLKHKNGWNITRLLEIHKRKKYYRIFRLLNTDYKNWLN